MNKLSKKTIWIGVGILAVLILIAGLFLFIERKQSMRGELETLRIETEAMNQDFSEEYHKKDTFSEYSESIRQEKTINREGFMPIEERYETAVLYIFRSSYSPGSGNGSFLLKGVFSATVRE